MWCWRNMKNKGEGRSIGLNEIFYGNFWTRPGEVDIEAQGSVFTWSNGRDEKMLIRERLDRAIASPEWLWRYEKAGVRVLTVTHSDHNPIMHDSFLTYAKGFKPFCFYEAWSMHPGCREVVQDSWGQLEFGPTNSRLMERFGIVGRRLKRWQHEKWGEVKNRI